MVVKRGQNDQDIVAMANHFKGRQPIVRFIKFMDVGTSNGWKMAEVVPSVEVIRLINAELPLERVPSNYEGETCARWRYRDGSREIGVISSVTQSFCQSCTRARVWTDGTLFTCLFETDGHDLRALMRGGCSDEQLQPPWPTYGDSAPNDTRTCAAPRPVSFRRPARRRSRCPALAAELATTMNKERYP